MRHALPRVPLHHSFQSVNQIEALFVVFFFKRQSYLFFLIYAIIIYSDFVLSRFFVLFWLRFELKLYPSFTDLKGDGALIYPLFSFTLPTYILWVNQVWRKSGQRVRREGAEARAWGRMAVLAVPVSCGAVPAGMRHRPQACRETPPPPDRAMCRMAACMHLTQTGRQETENSYSLTAELCSARGKNPAPYPCSAFPPCAVERQRLPPATERGRSILHRYSIAMASLPDMMTENKPGSRRHRAGIERPEWPSAECGCPDRQVG